MVQGWVMAWEVVTSLGSGNLWYVVLQDVGPPVFAVTDVLNPVVPNPKHFVEAHKRMSLRWSLAVFPSSSPWFLVGPLYGVGTPG